MDLEQISSGNSEALGRLLKETWAPLVLYLNTILDSMEAAEDAAQESYVRLWEHRDRWTSGSARPLIFRIGRNVALDLRRKAEVRRRWIRSHRRDPVLSPPTPEEGFNASELHRQFREALESLPPRRREVFELIRLRGLSHRDVAQVMDISYQTVANHLRLAMQDLRRLVSDVPLEPPVDDALGGEERSSDG